MLHRRGNRGSKGNKQLLPNKIIGGATRTSCCPIFFCNKLQLTVTLQTVRLPLSQKSPSFWGFAPDPIVHCVYLFSKHTYCIKLYFKFNCLDCFSHAVSASPTEKSSNFAPQPKNRSRAYTLPPFLRLSGTDLREPGRQTVFATASKESNSWA